MFTHREAAQSIVSLAMTYDSNDDLCIHKFSKSTCSFCKMEKIDMCTHLSVKSLCRYCKLKGSGGESLCQHLTMISMCIKCKLEGRGGQHLCRHLLITSLCEECEKEMTDIEEENDVLDVIYLDIEYDI